MGSHSKGLPGPAGQLRLWPGQGRPPSQMRISARSRTTVALCHHEMGDSTWGSFCSPVASPCLGPGGVSSGWPCHLRQGEARILLSWEPAGCTTSVGLCSSLCWTPVGLLCDHLTSLEMAFITPTWFDNASMKCSLQMKHTLACGRCSVSGGAEPLSVTGSALHAGLRAPWVLQDRAVKFSDSAVPRAVVRK